MKRLLVAGIGSHNPGDELGWQALEALQKEGLALAGYLVDWRAIEHPAVDLLPALQDADAALLLDALAGGGLPEVRALSLNDLQRLEHSCSSHGFSVAEVLGLAASVGQLPEPLMIFGLQGELESLMPSLRRQIRAHLDA